MGHGVQGYVKRVRCGELLAKRADQATSEIPEVEIFRQRFVRLLHQLHLHLVGLAHVDECRTVQEDRVPDPERQPTLLLTGHQFEADRLAHVVGDEDHAGQPLGFRDGLVDVGPQHERVILQVRSVERLLAQPESFVAILPVPLAVDHEPKGQVQSVVLAELRVEVNPSAVEVLDRDEQMAHRLVVERRRGRDRAAEGVGRLAGDVQNVHV